MQSTINKLDLPEIERKREEDNRVIQVSLILQVNLKQTSREFGGP